MGLRAGALSAVLGAIAILANAGLATAQDYPSRRINIITPFAPGASSDLMARVAGNSLSEVLKQTVTVENRTGANSLIATRAVKNGPADGYTLLFQTNAFHSSVVMPDAGYVPEDFVTIAAVGTTAYVLVAPTAASGKSWQDFIAGLKAPGSKPKYGSLGSGTQQMILGERFRDAAGVPWVEVPYKSGADVIAPLINNEIQGFFATVNLANQQASQPAIRSLAVSSEQRSAYLPDVPTFKELGLPQMAEEGYFMLLAPAATPKPIVDKLREAMKTALTSPAVRKQIQSSMVEPYTGTVEAFDAYTKVSLDRFKENNRKYVKP